MRYVDVYTLGKSTVALRGPTVDILRAPHVNLSRVWPASDARDEVVYTLERDTLPVHVLHDAETGEDMYVAMAPELLRWLRAAADGTILAEAEAAFKAATRSKDAIWQRQVDVLERQLDELRAGKVWARLWRVLRDAWSR
jgi:hypothetical protein